nr:PREDICTED: uncharacterized protein LOC105678356 isoform X1 [Linepithema humile]
MIVLKKFATLFLSVFVILPILQARFYHGYSSYRQYSNNLINAVKYPMTKEISEQSDYNRNGREEGIKYSEGNSNYADLESNFRFSNNDGLQAQNDDSNNIEKISVPKGCSDQFTCENNSEYPQELVNRILYNNPHLFAYAFENSANIDSRIDIKSKMKNFCSFRKRYYSPQQARNIHGEWKWIIQSDDMDFHQRIYTEECVNKNKSCSEIQENLEEPLSYTTKCVQRYIYYNILTVNGNQANINLYKFPFMCCCDIEERKY